MRSPAPASSLAEPPPAANSQLGRWICQQGLRSARIRGLLLVLAAANAAASTTTAPAFLRLVTFRTQSGSMITYIIPGTCYGFIRHGIRVTLLYVSMSSYECLGTSGYCLVIVIHAVMT